MTLARESSRPSLYSRIARCVFLRSRTRAQLSTIDALREEVALLSAYSTDTIYRLDYATMRYSYISPNVTRLLGYTPQEIAALNVRTLIEETRLIDESVTKVESYAGLELVRQNREVNMWQADYLMRTKDGRAIWVADISYPVRDASGAAIGSVGSLRDITARVYAESQMKEAIGELAVRDAVTGMLSRKAYHHRLEEELKRLKRARGEVALMLMDIDNFLTITAQQNTEFSEFVLTELTKLVYSCLRETDIAARVDANGFAFILADTTAEGAFWVAERIRTTVSNHSFTNSRSSKPQALMLSFGIASTRHGEAMDAHELHSTADKRLAFAKHGAGAKPHAQEEQHATISATVLH